MTNYPIFLSVVLVLRNQSSEIENILKSITYSLSSYLSDWELIIVDNASTDDSLTVLKELTSEKGLPNLQVYALTKEVDTNTANWVGLESALGDFVAVADPLFDSLDFLPFMLDKAISGIDVVFANNKQKPNQSLAYNAAVSVFNTIFKWFNGINLSKEAPEFRVLSRHVINFILRHPQPAMAYRHLPATGGFTKTLLEYSSKPFLKQRKNLLNSIDRGMRLLVSTTRGPMRMVTSFSLFGAISNLFYSFYVVAVWFFKSDVAPGWVSMSLQQSGMFFLISLVLLVLGEYILNMATLSNEGPQYYVSQEFKSSNLSRLQKLNIEEPDISKN